MFQTIRIHNGLKHQGTEDRNQESEITSLNRGFGLKAELHALFLEVYIEPLQKLTAPGLGVELPTDLLMTC